MKFRKRCDIIILIHSHRCAGTYHILSTLISPCVTLQGPTEPLSEGGEGGYRPLTHAQLRDITRDTGESDSLEESTRAQPVQVSTMGQ